ncbi:MAG: hypothetical protein ACKOKB_00340 [Bacteroidota bacterium]
MLRQASFKFLLPLILVIPLVAWAFLGANPAEPLPDKQSIKVSNASAPKIFPKSFFGFNAQQIRGPVLSENSFIRAVKGLNPAVLRYPGGTVASYWDWKAGWFKDEIPLKKDWREIRKNPIRLEDLKAACDSTGAAPLLVLNMCTSTLEYQLAMLQHAKKIGMKVNHVELDNELYISESIYTDRFSSGEDYANECNKWIVAIKKEYPDMRIAVVGYSAKDSDFRKNKKEVSRAVNWNREVLGTIRGADAMTFHIYGGNALNYLRGPGDISGDEDKESMEYQAIFDRGTSPPLALGIPFSRWENSKAYDLQLLPSGMKAWITEYNLFEREGVMAGTWLHGLYAVTQTLLMLESDQVELSCYHNLSSSAQFGAIFNSDQGFIKAVKQKPTAELGLSAAGNSLSMAGKTFKGATHYTQLRFDGVESIKGARGHAYPALIGVSCTGSQGDRILVVNLSDKSARIDVSAVLPKGGSWSQVISKPATQVASSADVERRKIKSATASDLPPYSITLISSGVEP